MFNDVNLILPKIRFDIKATLEQRIPSLHKHHEGPCHHFCHHCLRICLSYKSRYQKLNHKSFHFLMRYFILRERCDNLSPLQNSRYSSRESNHWSNQWTSYCRRPKRRLWSAIPQQCGDSKHLQSADRFFFAHYCRNNH